MGPLQGIRVIELAGLGPAPFCAMMLADMGATVVRVDRASAQTDEPDPVDTLLRNRRSIALNLKSPAGISALLRLIDGADALIEGFRPGVAERLGVGPDVCLARNPKLVYGRMTGWGQSGPLAHSAGHDINYLALTGALHLIGERDRKPVPPLNLVADFGGGGMMLLSGLLAALLEASRSGKGQVIDAAMTEGAASLMAIFYGRMAAGHWRDERGVNVLDTGAPWYDAYETADGKHVAIGSIEGRFYAELIERLGLDPKALPGQFEFTRWSELRAAFSAAFRTRTRDEWCKEMEGTDVCFAPVLSLTEAPQHAHNRARGAFVEMDGVTQPAPAPRFSRTPGAIARGAPRRGQGGAQALADWGFDENEIEGFRARGALMSDA